jgi:dihydroflavonol-4-reductase
MAAYIKSKTLAERAAWDFAGESGLELAAVNPTGVFGPVLGPDLAASTLMVRQMLEGRIRRVPRIHFGVCDARDIADLHIRAMLDPAAAGERFLGASDGGAISMAEAARAVLARLGEARAAAAVSELPDAAVRIAALWDERARRAVPSLGVRLSGSSAKAQAMLGWRPRPREEALTATAQSLLRLGLARRG